MTFVDKLKKLGACKEAIEFAQGFTNLKKSWDSCERGDWMLWLLGKLSGKPESQSRRKLVLTACQCARLSLKYVPKKEKRPLKAIQTAESWAERKKGVTLNDVKKAAFAVASAITNVTSPAFDYDYTAYAAVSGAYAAAYGAASAAYVTPDAAFSAYAASHKETLKKCADIVRKNYPKAPKL